MRATALLISVLVLSGCTLTNLAKGVFSESGSLAKQPATHAQMNAMLERVMLSCNDGKDDWSHLVPLLKQSGYQQVNLGDSFFYNSPTPLYFKGYPVLYLRGIADYTDFVGMAFPPEAYSKLKQYSIRKTIILADVGRRDISGGADRNPDSTDGLVFWSCGFHDS